MILTLLMGNTAFAQQSAAKFTSQNNSDFAKTISDRNIQLIDVRTAGEFSSGHIPSAINIDVNSREFNQKTARLDKNHPVALYCRSGARSKAAAKRLAEQGFIVYELDRGIMNWDGATTTL